MTDLLFDLQRFNSGGATEQDTTPDLDFDIGIDENGDVIFVEDDNQDSAPEQPDYHTPEEIRDVGIDKLDPNRIPPELLPYYKSMQADYVRKTQDLATQRKQLEQHTQPQPQPQTQAQPEYNPKAYYEQLYGIAKSSVEKAIGEDYDEFNPLHQTALADEVANIKAHIIQQQQFHQNLGNVMNKYTQDPSWAEIDRYALEKLNNMPYQIATQVKQRIDSGDLAFIDQYLGMVKQEYYKSKNPQPQVVPQQKPRPPFMESGGGGEQPNNSPRQMDYKSLGKMKMDDQVKLFEKFGLTNM